MGLTYDEQEPLWDTREGLEHHGEVPLAECVRRLHRALPTAAHAGQLIEAMLDALGEQGRLDPYTDGSRAIVRRADPAGWWCRRPPAALSDGAQWSEIDVHTEVPRAARPAPGSPEPPSEPPPDIVPEGLNRAVITFWSGEAVLEVRYGDEGLAQPERVLCRFGDRWAEQRFGELWPPTVDPRARPPQAPPPPWLVDLPDGLTVGALAERILATGPELDPVRVRMNVDAPGGIMGCWARARSALVQLAMDGALPTSGGVYVLDAYDHEPHQTCLAVGADLAEAEAAWLAEERRLRPRPARKHEPVPELPKDAEPPSEREVEGEDGKTTKVISTGLVRLVIQPVRVIPWPIPGPRTTPAVAIRVPAMPEEIPQAWRAEGFSRWHYLFGDSGNVGFALIRDEDDGMTVVGDGLLDVVEPRGLEQQIEAAIAASRPFPYDEPPWIRYPYEHRYFSAWSNLHQRPGPLQAQNTTFNAKWTWGNNGDIRRWHVARLRYHQV